MSAESRTGRQGWAIAFFGENEGQKMIFAENSKYAASYVVLKRPLRWE